MISDLPIGERQYLKLFYCSDFMTPPFPQTIIGDLLIYKRNRWVRFFFYKTANAGGVLKLSQFWVKRLFVMCVSYDYICRYVLNIQINIHLHICIYITICLYINICISLYIYVCMCICMYIYIIYTFYIFLYIYLYILYMDYLKIQHAH